VRGSSDKVVEERENRPLDGCPARYIAAVTEGEDRLIAGRYRLHEPLGRGGMGMVWRARDEYLQRNVAVKEVRLPDSSATEESEPPIPRTLREARAAAQLRHPGIVTVHDVVTYEDRPWIVMELIEGRSLADVLHDDGPLSERRTAEIGIQVLHALEAAHHHGVLHRDVKPGNIMLDGDRVVLTDFGIAMIDGAEVLTETGQLIGSPEYIAPERIDGHEATHACDLWAVGVTLYSMLAGRSPFRRTDKTATLAAIIARDPDPHPSIHQLWPVIQGLLRKKPAERLTVQAAVELLSKIAETPPPPASGPATAPVVAIPTLIETPQPEATKDTLAKTRSAAPAFLPPTVYTEPVARPADETLDPTAPPTPRRDQRPRARRMAVMAGIAVLVAVAAIISLPVLLAWPANQTTGRSSPPPPSTSPGRLASTTGFAQYQDPLGFSISVPRGWTRTSSTVSALSDVVWQGPQPDPAVGTLNVQVQRDDSASGTAAYAYLKSRDTAESTNADNADYRRVVLRNLPAPGNTSAAELEYTHGSPVGTVEYHVLTRAMVGGSGAVYVLTFSVYANDSQTLQAQWQAVAPTLAVIRDSFQLTG
jgi:serine/threonine protein kinase